jgi:alkanesulfonate monooxygenase SsuD/methylene tetrahydromethanopterin reductase-like flavin-dependent oxidoreductase (luciferase family)
MSLPRQFGLTLPQRGIFFDIITVPELVETGQYADETGVFDYLWVGDSLLAKPRPESVALLGSLAGVTNQVRLAVGCMASFPVRDPILFADQWATLDQISEGRMLLAVCTGLVKAADASAKEGALYGVTDASRAGRLAEYMSIVRQLWTEDDVTVDGKYVQFQNVTLSPKPVQQPPPIYIASNPDPNAPAERPLRRVARLADGWMTTRKTPEHLTSNGGTIKQYLTEEGHDPDTFPFSAYHNLNLNPDRDAAYEESFKFLRNYYGPVYSREDTRHWTAAGSVNQVITDLRQLFNEDATDVTLRITSWDWRNQLPTLVNDVIPAVRTN